MMHHTSLPGLSIPSSIAYRLSIDVYFKQLLAFMFATQSLQGLWRIRILEYYLLKFYIILHTSLDLFVFCNKKNQLHSLDNHLLRGSTLDGQSSATWQLHSMDNHLLRGSYTHWTIICHVAGTLTGQSSATWQLHSLDNHLPRKQWDQLLYKT